MAVTGAEDSILILKHVGGLTSGQTMPLRRGVYQFGPSKTEDAGLDVGDPAVVSFELEVRGPDDVILSPGRDAVSIEGRTVSQPLPITTGRTIQAGPDLFVLTTTADEASAKRIVAPTSPIIVPKVHPTVASRYLPLLWLAGLSIIAGVALSFILDELLWLALAGVGLVVAGVVLLMRRRAEARAKAENEQKVTQAKGELAGSLMERRIVTAQEARSQSTGPADVLQSFAGDGSDPNTADLAIGAGTKPWKPPIGSLQGAGWDPQGIIDGHSSLAAVPFETELAKPFAVAGPRPAALAFARYLTLAVAEKVGANNIAIDTDEPSDWAWADGLLSPSTDNASFVVRDRTDGTTPRRGLLLTSEPHPVPPGVGGLLSISTTGVAKLHDGIGNTVADDIVPYGVTSKSAVAAKAGASAERLRREEIREARRAANREVEAAAAQRNAEVQARRAKAEVQRTEAETQRLEEAEMRAQRAAVKAAEQSAGIAPEVTEVRDATSDVEVAPLVDPAAVATAPARPPRPAPPTDADLRKTPPDPPPFAPSAPTRPTAPAKTGRDATSTTLFLSDDLGHADALVASVTIDLAERLTPDRFAFAVLDSGSRPLIRLRQMFHCNGYAGIDHDASVDALLDMVERHQRQANNRLLLLAVSDLVATLAYLDGAGRYTQAQQLRNALAAADGKSLIVIGSSPRSNPPSHDLAEVVMSQVERYADGTARVRDSRGSRPLSFNEASGQDLTGSVARLTTPQR